MEKKRECGPILKELVEGRPLAVLGPGKPIEAMRSKLAAVGAESFAPPRVKDAEMASACLAGLWLAYDFLDESHRVSQELDTAEGSFWHAILHRREPDAWNSKYWWRRVGAHGVVEQVREKAGAMGYRYTTPEAFVDYVERVRGSGSAEEMLARRVQGVEWELLFDWCYSHSVEPG